jgi:general secretion pathway protein D
MSIFKEPMEVQSKWLTGAVIAIFTVFLAISGTSLMAQDTGNGGNPNPPPDSAPPPGQPTLPNEDQDLPEVEGASQPEEQPADLPPPAVQGALPTPAEAQKKPSVPSQPIQPSKSAESSKAADAPKGAQSVPSGQELVNIDFPEPTEIKDIIKAVALWTGKNVILDRQVSGKVQIISPRKVTKEEAYQAFLSALNLLGLTTVETGKVIKIMPVRTAVKGNLKTFLGSSWTPQTDEIITQIVPLKYIDAKEIQSTLSRIVSSNAMIAYPPTNTLIISDSGYKVRRVLDILDLLDVQGQQAQVAIVPIKYAEAKSIADKVQEIFRSGGTKKTPTSGGRSSYGGYKIMTDERTNSVVIFGPPRTIADVKSLVQKFDIRLDDPSRQASIHVRPLDYASATKLASTLQALASGQKSNNIRRPPISRPMQPGGTVGSASPAVAELDDNVKITADEASNSLLVTGSHAAYQAVNSIIRKLDIRRSQVFVESDILDISMGSGFNFETHIFGGRGGAQNSSIATTWQAKPMGPLVAAQASGKDATSATQLKEVAGVFASEDLTVGVLSGKDIEIKGLGKFRPGALIRMLKQDTNTRIISSPHILTSNNEEAKIVVGERLFFRTTDTNPQTGVNTSKVERENVDLTLTIKPNISHSNYVTMNVDLEENSVAGIDATSGLPRVNSRKTKQLVTVKNGQTIVVSGLVDSREYEAYKKIPLLGDIPIIGWLFRNSQLDKKRTNLMIFMTPHIIHGADDLAAVYQAKITERDQFLESIFGSGYKDDDFYAMLPTKEDGAYQADEMDNLEKARRQEMLDQMYKSTGSGSGEGGANEGGGNDGGGAVDGEMKDAPKSKSGDDPIYVPMTGDDAGGAGGSFDGGESMDNGGAPMEPPPADMPMDAPEPIEPPPPDNIDG